MKNLSICKTTTNNCYLVSDKPSQYHVLLTPLVLYFLKQENHSVPEKLIIEGYVYNKEEIAYYHNKFLFLKKHGLFKKKEKPKLIIDSFTPQGIKWQVANLKYLVFEVTDACNLKCKYCGYGELYNNYDERNNKNMSFETAKTIIDYLINSLIFTKNQDFQRDFGFGFYGGEPLLNISLIKEVVLYIEKNLPASIIPSYYITTNGMLLDKYMDYLVEKNFSILISCDGNQENHSYRVTHNGINSFDKVYANTCLLKQRYPDFFFKKVNFNAVLHNKNSVEEIFEFINKEFGKLPSIAEINNNGIAPNKIQEYNQTFKSKDESLYHSENYEQLSEKLGIQDPYRNNTIKYLQKSSGNFYKTYSHLLEKEGGEKHFQTGTCSPFERKMFLTVDGKILPCERIGQQHILGQISDGTVELDFEAISQKYMNYIEKLQPQCSRCDNSFLCTQCLFYLETIEQEKPICHGFMNLKETNEYIAKHLSFLEKNPTVYTESLETIYQ